MKWPIFTWFSRRACLKGRSPGLASSIDRASELAKHLRAEGLFAGEIWLYNTLEMYATDVPVHEHEGSISDDLSGVMAETNPCFEKLYCDDAEVLEIDDGITI